MLDLQAFATDFLALSTGPSRLDLLVLSLPTSQRALTTLSSSLSALLAHYALPHPASPATWAAEDAAAALEDERALPRLFQRALALRGDAWQRFLAEQPASPATAAGQGTPSQRRGAFVAWCVERNPLLTARAGESAEESGGAPRRKRQEASWPPAPPSPTPSAPGEQLGTLVSARRHETAPPTRRAVSQTSTTSEAPDSTAPSPSATPPRPPPSPSRPSTPRLKLEASPVLEEQPAARPLPPPTAAQPSTPTEQASPPSSSVVDAADGVRAAPSPVVDEPTTLGDVTPSLACSTSDQVEPLEPLVVECALDPVAAGLSSSIVDEPPSEDTEQSAPPSPTDETVVDVPAILLTGDGGEPVELVHESSLADNDASDATTGEDVALVDSALEPSPPTSAGAPDVAPAAPPLLRILALDGGALLGPVPQLDVLHSLLRPSSSPSPSPSTTVPSPAQHFGLLAGTASSALLAVLLGRLALDLDNARALYVRIARRALALDGPAGTAARTSRTAQAPQRRPSRWSRLFRRSSSTQDSSTTGHEPGTGAAELAAERGRALAAALAELLPGADEPFACSSPRQPHIALLAFRAGPSGRVEPTWLVSDDPSSAPGLTVAQAVLASAAASALVACPGWSSSPTSLSTAQGALELGQQAAAAAAQGPAAPRARVELVSLGTGYASLRLPAVSSSTLRAALEAVQQAAAANAVAAAALARKLDGREDVELRRLEGHVVRRGVLDGREEWEESATSAGRDGLGAAGGKQGERNGLGKADQPGAPLSLSHTRSRCAAFSHASLTEDASYTATLHPDSPSSARAPLKKRASRLSFLFGGGRSRDARSSSPSPSPRQASFGHGPASQPPSSPPPPPSPLSPALTVPHLRTSISLDDLRRCGPGASGGSAGRGESGGMYALGEDAWGSSASVRSG